MMLPSARAASSSSSVVGDRGSSELLRHALLYFPRSLADLEEPGVGIVGNGIGVDARSRLRLCDK